ncbi:cation diffusion facilitator family transporter [Micromonosporaceae bacterium Da 78-11]
MTTHYAHEHDDAHDHDHDGRSPGGVHGAADTAGHAHGHDGGQGHDGHSHGVSVDADRRWLSLALGLITAFMAGEVVVGLLAHSLALLSDAAHMLTDAGSIVLALIAMRLAARPPAGGYTYGLKRAEILSAQANGLSMLILAVWLGVESIRRLIHPPPVVGGLVLATALVGVAVNLLAAWSMSKANRSSLNVDGAFQHILNDLFAFIATAIAGLIIVLTGFTRADGIATLLVVALMIKAGIGLVRASGRIFLEAAPHGLDPAALGARIVALPGVAEVHDLHVWEITSGQPALSAHVLVDAERDCHAVRADIQALLAADYRITHATLQADHIGENPTTKRPEDQADPHCADPHGAVYHPTT